MQSFLCQKHSKRQFFALSLEKNYFNCIKHFWDENVYFPENLQENPRSTFSQKQDKGQTD